MNTRRLGLAVITAAAISVAAAAYAGQQSWPAAGDESGQMGSMMNRGMMQNGPMMNQGMMRNGPMMNQRMMQRGPMMGMMAQGGQMQQMMGQCRQMMQSWIQQPNEMQRPGQKTPSAPGDQG